MTRFGLVLGAMLVAMPAMAQKASEAAPSRDQIRLAILDQCVLTQSGKLAEEGAGPKCGCYARSISKAMTDEEVADYRKSLPKRLADQSQKIFAGCK